MTTLQKIKHLIIVCLSSIHPLLAQAPCGNECPNMTWIAIPTGQVNMGNLDFTPTHQPIHTVSIQSPYQLSKSEVTVGQYRACVDAGICSTNHVDLYSTCNWTTTTANLEDHPMNCVDWHQARTFAKWIGGDLPSESEWEFAAKNAQNTQVPFLYPWGLDEPSCTLANFGRNCHQGTNAVCSYVQGQTTQGLCDMAGNVWEWVLDEWFGSYLNAPILQNAWCVGENCDDANALRIYRGGSYDSFGFVLRSFVRNYNAASVYGPNLGFRVVKHLGNQCGDGIVDRSVFEQVSFSGVDASRSLLGGVDSLTINGYPIRDSIASDDTVSKYNTAYQGQPGYDGSTSAIAKAKVINESYQLTGVRAIVGETRTDANYYLNSALGGYYLGTSGSIQQVTLTANTYMEINGSIISNIEVQADDADGSLRSTINEVSDQTGVVAEINANGELILIAHDGRNIQVSYTDDWGGGQILETLIGLRSGTDYTFPSGTYPYGGKLTLQSDTTFELDFTGSVNTSLGVISQSGLSDILGELKYLGTETCDDGNSVNTDSCRNNCTKCGDRIVQDGEICDDGNTYNLDSCLNTCVIASCGDGFTQTGVEACDDANQDNTDTCLNTCVVASCGDGFIQGTEQCDDGNLIANDTCNQYCSGVCGDGLIQLGEECDDGNQNDNDDCTNQCVLSTCGDGILNPNKEECDDGNQYDLDSCSNKCFLSYCGDGLTNWETEECDEIGESITCDIDCTLSVCGDGIINSFAGEACDDGNSIQTDGCNQYCSGVCGDGIVQLGEECDDGNSIQTDGCLNSCIVMEMVLIQAGSFNMGSDVSPSEQPIHNVQITSDFYVGKTEVTVGQYRACVNAGVCTEPDSSSYYNNYYCNWSSLVGTRETHPINCVDWNQARTFAKWIGGDLLTEAQWEYVATAQGQAITYPWGNAEPTCQLANYLGCVGSTAPVCSTIGGNTTQGVCDMGGNVWEWVLDQWHNYYSGAPANEQAWCNNIEICNTNTSVYRVFRGGSWGNDASYLRSAYRYGNSSGLRGSHLGFRVSDIVP